MGDHYVPKRYLENFVDPLTKKLWIYEKTTLRAFNSQPKSVANETGYYSPQVEQYLANKIEPPANNVITKLINQQPITDEDKLMLSRYIVVMIKRVPEGKELLRLSATITAQSYTEKLMKEEASEKQSIDRAQIQRVAELLKLYVKDMPKDIWLESLTPERTPEAVDALCNMSWRLFICKEPSSGFLTSDNPVCFIRNLGLGRPDSEVTFPISNHVALWATPPQNDEWYIKYRYIPIGKRVIRLINLQTVANATRYIYSSVNSKWMPKFIERHRD